MDFYALFQIDCEIFPVCENWPCDSLVCVVYPFFGICQVCGTDPSCEFKIGELKLSMKRFVLHHSQNLSSYHCLHHVMKEEKPNFNS